MKVRTKNRSGFTLVELLIVIVIIAILAAITIVAYNGIQTKARDSARVHAIQVITTALENYYTVNGQYPPAGNSSTIGSGWSTTADSSWQFLINQLQPDISTLPTDPISVPNVSVLGNGTGYNFAYFSNASGAYCGVAKQQMYILAWRFESQPLQQVLNGTCGGTNLGPPTQYTAVSLYRVVKN